MTFKYPDTKDVVYHWTKDIIPNYIIPQIEVLSERGLKSTVRGMLYYLESLRVMQKNDRTYTKLKKALSSARKGRRRRDGSRGKTIIAKDAFADNTRHIVKEFENEERSLDAYINDGIQHFKTLPDGFKKLVPRWLDQPNYVEVWLEKDAMTDNVKKILEGRDVVIVPNRGYTSIPFFHDNVERLAERFDNSGKVHKIHVHVFYLGDLDPNGWSMDHILERELSEAIGGPWVTFRRIGITYEQILDNNLKHLLTPTPEVLTKLENPNNMVGRPFKEHFGRLFQVELDAIQLIPNFEKLITEPIDELYKQEIYEQVLSRPEYSQDPNTIKKQIKEALEQLIDELEDTNTP